MNKKYNISLLLLLITAGIIRLLLVGLPGFKSDVDTFFAWATRLYELGFGKFYSNDVFTDYTPGYLYVLYPLGFLYNLFKPTSELFYIWLKIPSIIAELGIGFLSYLITYHYTNKKTALIITSLVLFSPALIFNTAVWGQVDAVLTFFLLLGIYLLDQKKLILATIALTIAFLIKPQAIAIIPVLAIYIFKNFHWKTISRLLFPSLIIITLLSWPFFPMNPIGGLYNRISQTADQYSYTSLNAYNIWGALMNFWGDDKEIWFGLSLHNWSLLLLAIYWIVIGLLFWKRKINLYVLSSLAYLAFFFLPTRVHERYLYPALPFLFISLVFYRSYLLRYLVLGLSILFFFDLYYVYVYYLDFFQLPKLLKVSAIYDPLAQHPRLISFISTLLFLTISFILLQSRYVKKTK